MSRASRLSAWRWLHFCARVPWPRKVSLRSGSRRRQQHPHLSDGRRSNHPRPASRAHGTAGILWRFGDGESHDLRNLLGSPTLQTGAPTSMSATYPPIVKRMLRDYPGHGIDNNNTQYFQIVSGITTYIHNTGTWGGAFVDTSPYPASVCTDPQTPGNCLTNTQLQHEIKKVLALKGWTGGINHLFLLFTSEGEGSCISSSSTVCAYNPPNGYCGYHSAFFNAVGSPIIYANEPYGELTHCQAPSIPSPNGDAVADAAASIAAHEVTESITDPLPGSGWVTASGNEIGDLCAYNYGILTWASGNANEMWNGDFFVLQQMFDNRV